MDDSAEYIAQSLLGGKKARSFSDGWYMTKCPCHDDRKPSLGLKNESNGDLIVNCLSGCSPNSIYKSLKESGFVFTTNSGKDSNSFQLPAKKEQPKVKPTSAEIKAHSTRKIGDYYRFRTPEGKIKELKIADIYPYSDEFGEWLFDVYRSEYYQEENGERQKLFMAYPSGATKVFYNLPDITNREKGSVVHLTEGEKDADSLTKLGLVATTAPFNAITPEMVSSLHGADIIIHVDNDTAGKKLARQKAEKLIESANSIKLVYYPELPNKGDVTDYLENHSKEELLEHIEKNSQPYVTEQAKKHRVGLDALDDKSCSLDDLEAVNFTLSPDGNAKRIRYYCRDKLIVITAARRSDVRYMVFNGKYWEGDYIKALSMVRQALRTSLSKEEQFHQSDDSRKKAFLNWFKRSEVKKNLEDDLFLSGLLDGMNISKTAFDVAPSDKTERKHLFNVQNGTLNLDTQELEPHSAKDYLTNIANVNYIKDLHKSAPPVVFNSFMNDICCNDLELVEWLKTFFGYLLLGEPSEQIFTIFHGDGKNGKSTLLSLIKYIFGSYGGSLNPNVFQASDKQTTTSNNPEILNVRNCRFVYLSESDKGAVYSESLIKGLTGNDDQAFRYNHANETISFHPQFSPILQTNNKPVFRDGSFGMLRRLKCVPFDYIVPDNKEDHKLMDKLKAESDSIFADLVEHAFLYMHKGLPYCNKIDVETGSYIQVLDPIRAFIQNCFDVEPSGIKYRSSELYGEYIQFMKRSLPFSEIASQKAFGTRLNALSTELGFLVKKESDAKMIYGLKKKVVIEAPFPKVVN